MINNIVIAGRLTRDPELKTTTSGLSVLSFDIANDRAYTKGADKKTDFYTVVAWRNTAEFVARNFSKGQMIGITGHLQTGEYTDKNGTKHKTTEIVADNVDFMGDKKPDNLDVTPPAPAPERPARIPHEGDDEFFDLWDE